MKFTAVLVLLAFAAVARAQIQICDGNRKPGQVSGSTIKMSATAFSNSYSSLSVNWPRPTDRTTPGGLDSCISSYDVRVLRASDNQQLQAATVSTSAAAMSASYTAKGLSPGTQYKVVVTPNGPAGTGAPGSPSPAFTTAAAPAPSPSCRQPQMVSNIRRTAGAPTTGNKATMTISWDPSSSPRECVKEYVITVYPAGSNSAIKTTTVPGSQTSFTDTYEAGKSYEFYIYGRNPALGASGNGIGLKSAPIAAPAPAQGVMPL